MHTESMSAERAQELATIYADKAADYARATADNGTHQVAEAQAFAATAQAYAAIAQAEYTNNLRSAYRASHGLY